MARQTIEERIKARAFAQGFDAVGIAPARLPGGAADDLEAFVAAGLHGTMGWMEETLPRRKSPRSMWPDARSAIVCAMNYGPPPGLDPLARLAREDRGVISLYALGRDYHDVLKGRLKQTAQLAASLTGEDVKVFVDTAPLMEKRLAALSGIGWPGKHTCVVSRGWGGWLFLGVILTAARLTPDAPSGSHCGSCTACLDICPTKAFLGPGRIDARRCISYLTIEHDGPVPRSLRPLMGNRIFGCDDCLAICPWNHFAKEAGEERLRPRPQLVDPPLAELAALDDAVFRRMFAGTPVRRARRDRFVANVMIAIGNSGRMELSKHALARLGDESPLVRGMAVWALSRLLSRGDFRALHGARQPDERAALVLREWRAALKETEETGETGGMKA